MCLSSVGYPRTGRTFPMVIYQIISHNIISSHLTISLAPSTSFNTQSLSQTFLNANHILFLIAMSIFLSLSKLSVTSSMIYSYNLNSRVLRKPYKENDTNIAPKIAMTISQKPDSDPITQHIPITRRVLSTIVTVG